MENKHYHRHSIYLCIIAVFIVISAIQSVMIYNLHERHLEAQNSYVSSEELERLSERIEQLTDDRKSRDELLHILNEECYRLSEELKAMTGRRQTSMHNHSNAPVTNHALVGDDGFLAFEATAYTDGGVTANGYDTRGKGWLDSMIIAVDPSVIPLGSQVYIQFDGDWAQYNGVYSAEDTGGAVRGNIVDIFVGHGEDSRAFQFGRRSVRLKVL